MMKQIKQHFHAEIWLHNKLLKVLWEFYILKDFELSFLGSFRLEYFRLVSETAKASTKISENEKFVCLT